MSQLRYKDYFDGSVPVTDLNDLLRADLLVEMAPFYTNELLNRIFSSPYILANKWLGILVWAAFTAYAPGSCDSHVLDRNFEIAQSLKPSWKSTLVLSSIVPLLSKHQQEQVFVLALHMTSEWDSIKILATLAQNLSEGELIKVLELVQNFKNEQAVSHLLWKLASYLTVAHRMLSLEIAYNLKDEIAQVEVLTVLFSLLTTQQRLQAFNSTLSLIDEQKRIYLLVKQAPYLPALQRTQILDISLNLENKYLRPVMVATLLPYLGTEQHTEALDLVLREHIEESLGLSSVKPLVALLPFVSDNSLILQPVWSRMTAFLENVCLWPRSDILRNCFIDNNELFTSPILSPGIIEAMMLHIIEICEEWHWL